MAIVYSVHDVSIRLSPERWVHIVENHDDLAGYRDDILRVVEDPDIVVRGYRGSLIAATGYGRKRYLAVIYKEVSPQDGFIISAYFTSKIDRKKAIWTS